MVNSVVQTKTVAPETGNIRKRKIADYGTEDGPQSQLEKTQRLPRSKSRTCPLSCRNLILTSFVLSFTALSLWCIFGDGRPFFCLEADQAWYERFYELVESRAREGAKNNTRKYDFQPRENDIIIVGAMKSGTTWLQQITNSIRTRGNHHTKDIYNDTWFLPMWYQPATFNFNQNQMAEPRIFKSHEHWEYIPKGKNMRYIYIQRHPRDQMLSNRESIFRVFGRKYQKTTYPCVLKMFLTQSSKFMVDPGPHIVSWWPQRSRSDVLFLFYEDLQRDLRRVILRVANFMGFELSPTELEKVLYLSSFEYMLENKPKFTLQTAINQLMGNQSWDSPFSITNKGQQGRHEKLSPYWANLWIDVAWRLKIYPKISPGHTTYEELWKTYSFLFNENDT